MYYKRTCACNLKCFPKMLVSFLDVESIKNSTHYGLWYFSSFCSSARSNNVVIHLCKPVVWLYIQWILANMFWFKRLHVSHLCMWRQMIVLKCPLYCRLISFPSVIHTGALFLPSWLLLKTQCGQASKQLLPVGAQRAT